MSPARGDRRLTSQALYRAIALAAFLVVAGLLFEQLATLLLLVVMTILIAIPIAGVATWLERWRVPRSLGALIGLLGGLAIIAGIIALLVPAFVDEVNHFVNSLPGIVDDLLARVQSLTGANPHEVGNRAAKIARDYTDHPIKLLGPIASFGLGVVGVLGALIVMLITALYMAMNPAPLVNGTLRLFPPARRAWALNVMQRIRAAWIGWMRGLAVAMVLIGIFVYIGLQIVGLEFAVFFAVLSALFEVVPYFGALASGAPAVLLALTHSPGKALAVLLVFVLAHQVDGNIISPQVMARAVRLHPAIVAIGVVIVGKLFGVLGLIIAVPLMAAFVILVEEIWVKPNEHAGGVLVPAPAAPEQRLEKMDPAGGDKDGVSETPRRSAGA